ncbi:hypothetical protein QN277_025031 [Acacia crassicarpa]|uniref:Uncharacterized protein n=1 Tax=Acacia crassicarpa TaxID=499986 RepID=A0AAE1JHC5_9FABA|nr:hypothetical protein QN277_025031 [Acacia crassicarpa]
MEDSLAENEDSYIEIELDSSCAVGEVAPTTGVSNGDRIDQEVGDGDGGELKERQESEEYDDELRISISSRIALPDVVDDDDQQRVVDYSEKSVERSGSGPGPAPRPPLRQTDSADSDKGRRLDVDYFWENGSSDHQTHVTLQTTMPHNSCHDQDLHSSTSRHSRGKEGSMRRRNGGTIMKMLIKFRGIKLTTLISSLLKLPPPCQDQHNNKGHTRKYCRTILQCYHQKKNMVVNPSSGSSQQDRSPPPPSSKRSLEDATTSRRLSKPYWDLNNNINNISSGNEGSFRSTKRSSWNRSVVEIDMGALKGMFSAVGIAQKGNSSNKRKSCSTVSSFDNSPIHEGFSITCTTDNSIQAAIAYCKTSFGQTSDFSF